MNLATQDPTNYSAAAVVQLFYLCNWYHDKLYALGFTEAAGNFQSNNFARGGLGNDAVQADAQDGSGTDNANFSTPADGSPGRMQMYIFTGPNPRRDGDLDAEIVFHEHTHGLSWRLVGGGQALGDTQSDGMGEGWSDFYGLSLLSEAGDDVNGNYATGGYATYQLGGLTQNYYYGIRRYPYTTDMTKNPLTFKDIDPAQASTHAGVPRSPIIGTTANEVHNEGEVWCVTLWEARANLINKYGWAVGNQLMLQLTTDGMKLTVPHPNFLQARDGILQADLVDTGGANQNDLWAAFAKRGLGFSATSPASSTTTGLHEAFDVPDDLRVTPSTGLSSGGQIGGPFTPPCQNYAVTNAGTNGLTWTVTTTQPWVTLGSAGGNLPAGTGGAVSVCINVAANVLSAGNYSASVIFSNLTSGRNFSRTVSLVITPPQVVSFPLNSDPGWSRSGEWAFGKPSGLGGAAHGFADPSNGFTGTNVFGINLNGDYSIAIGGPYYLTTGAINCSAYGSLQLQFQRWLNSDYQPYVYATLEISTNNTSWSTIWSNGVTAVSDSAWTTVLYDISAYADRQPAVYLRWGHRVGQSGAFAYSGWNLDDIALLGVPSAPLFMQLPGTVTENAGVVVNGGNVQLTTALPTNLVISLVSSAPARLTVPGAVTILAGQLSAQFNLTAVDNSVHDGDQIVTVTANAGGFTNFLATTTVVDDDTPPSVTGQPANVSAAPGGTATFSVTATGKAPLSYFWSRNGAAISGANSSSYTTNNVQLADSGSTFSCLVSNAFGTAASSGAVLTVVAGLGNDVCANATLITAAKYTNTLSTITATSTGDPVPSCVGGFGKGVWYVYTPPTGGQLVVDTIGSGFDTGLGIYTGSCGALTQAGCDDDSGGNLTSKITLTVAGGTTYRIIAGGYAASSGSLVFHTTFTSSATPPVITVQPVSQTVSVGDNVTFTVAATSPTSLGYFWMRNGLPIAGANSFSYTTNNVQLSDSLSQFTCQVSNVFGSVTSAVAVLTVVAVPPSVVQSPADTTVLAGGSATFNVNATGSAPLSYFWKRNGSDIAGANASSYTTNNVRLADSGGLFSCLVSNAYGTAVSSAATLTVVTSAVAYFTDSNPTVTGPAAPIQRVGAVPLPIADISTFNLNSVNILFLDESSNSGLTTALQSRLPDIQAWINAGGKLIVHDRSVANSGNPNPLLLGAPGAVSIRLEGADVDVIPPADTLVTAGPFGTIDNFSLDGGTSSEHGYVDQTTLPSQARSILCIGGNTSQVVAFSYPLGSGFLYYSSIPLDFYLEGSGGGTFLLNVTNTYAPNMLLYVQSLAISSGMTLSQVQLDINGQLAFTVNGSPGDVFRVLASTNLADWQPIATVTNVTGTAPFTDADTTNYSQRYYRCVIP